MALNFGGGALFGERTNTLIPKRKTQFLSVHPSAFQGDNPDIDDIALVFAKLTTTGAVTKLFAPVVFPNEAHLVSYKLFGDAGLDGLQSGFVRATLATGAGSISFGAVNTVEIVPAALAEVNNEKYCYSVFVDATTTAGDVLFGALIEYEIDT